MLSVGVMSIDIRAILKKILLIYYIKSDWLLVIKCDSIHTFVTICTSPSWQTYTLISFTFVYALFSVNTRSFVTWPLYEEYNQGFQSLFILDLHTGYVDDTREYFINSMVSTRQRGQATLSNVSREIGSIECTKN